MNAAPLHPHRPLGSAPSPRRRFAAPHAVRIAQSFLLVRVVALLVLLLSGATVPALRLEAATNIRLQLPGSATWNDLAVWLVAGSLAELVLIVRLGTLRAGSRRAILLLESAVIAVSGLYVAAGLKPALLPLVAAIGAVVLLRLDQVRHSFNSAAATRRLGRRRIDAVLYEGYQAPDPTAVKQSQLIGYRVGHDTIEGSTLERSRA